MCFPHTFGVCVICLWRCVSVHYTLRDELVVCPCFFVVQGGNARGEVEGPWRAPWQLNKAFKGPRTRLRSCWEERKRIISTKIRGSLICPPKQRAAKKIALVARPGQGFHWLTNHAAVAHGPKPLWCLTELGYRVWSRNCRCHPLGRNLRNKQKNIVLVKTNLS